MQDVRQHAADVPGKGSDVGSAESNVGNVDDRDSLGLQELRDLHVDVAEIVEVPLVVAVEGSIRIERVLRMVVPGHIGR